MHRIDTQDFATVDGRNLFQDGGPHKSELKEATQLDAAWFNGVQENLCRFIEAQGIELTKGDYGLLTEAVTRLAESKAEKAALDARLALDGRCNVIEMELQSRTQALQEAMATDLNAARTALDGRCNVIETEWKSALQGLKEVTRKDLNVVRRNLDERCNHLEAQCSSSIGRIQKLFNKSYSHAEYKPRVTYINEHDKDHVEMTDIQGFYFVLHDRVEVSVNLTLHSDPDHDLNLGLRVACPSKMKRFFPIHGSIAEETNGTPAIKNVIVTPADSFDEVNLRIPGGKSSVKKLWVSWMYLRAE